jgi:hypothetical protein
MQRRRYFRKAWTLVQENLLYLCQKKMMINYLTKYCFTSEYRRCSAPGGDRALGTRLQHGCIIKIFPTWSCTVQHGHNYHRNSWYMLIILFYWMNFALLECQHVTNNETNNYCCVDKKLFCCIRGLNLGNAGFNSNILLVIFWSYPLFTISNVDHLRMFLLMISQKSKGWTIHARFTGKWLDNNCHYLECLGTVLQLCLHPITLFMFPDLILRHPGHTCYDSCDLVFLAELG